MKIEQSNISKLVEECWGLVRQKVENGRLLSSEKTLVFSFAMELVYRVGEELEVDFENQCFEGLEGQSKYLDLLFYTDKECKVAVEFKLPSTSKYGGSNQTQTRESVYRDLARLNYLKTSRLRPQACFFLMAVEENPYLNKGRKTAGTEYMTYHGHKINKDNSIFAKGIGLSGIEAQFKWANTSLTAEGKRVKSGKYAWLEPILV